MLLYCVPDPNSGMLRAARDPDTAAAYVVAWAILRPAEAELEGVPVVVNGRHARIPINGTCLLDRAAVAEALRKLC